MNQEQQVELLIRIDERTSATITEVTAINKKIGNLNCQKNSTRLEALERVIWPSVVSGILGFIGCVYMLVKSHTGGGTP